MAKQKTATVAPRRRFPAFSESGDWRVGPLAQLATVVAGQSPDGSNYNDVGQGIPFYQGKSEFGAIYLEEPTKWTTQTTKVAASGDIVMSVRAPVGALNVTTQEICIGRGLAAIKPKAEKWFLYYLLDRISGSIIGNGGSVFDSINKDQIEKLRVFWPVDRVEQQKIADCLTSLDEVIAAQGHKVERLKAHRRGLMQQLFPRKGETRPRLRFPEFRNAPEWDEKALGEVASVQMCKRIFASETNAVGGVPFYKIGTLGGVPDAYISKELFDEYKSKYNFPRVGEILITCSGTVGKCLRYDGRDSYFQDSNIVWIDNPTSTISNEFLFELISNVDWAKLNSTTITRIYGPDLRGLSINYPKDAAEQKRIADCLSSLDTRIAAETNQLAALKTHKQGLMQQLFPAPEAAEA